MLGSHVGNYRITRPIGEGGMGMVYEAVHDRLGQRAAIKVLSPEYAGDKQVVRRFCNEARAISRIDHPGIVRVFDFGRLGDGTTYIMMEYLCGESLHVRLGRLIGRLPLVETLRVCRQLAAALRAAHARGIIHRDIKPGNVYLVPDEAAEGGERVKLLDFGLAKLLRSSGLLLGDQAESVAGVAIGTPVYMAPEQCRGLLQIDGQADVYALGVLLYRLLSGQPPFHGRSSTEVMLMHVSTPPIPIGDLVPDLPRNLVALVMEMLAKAPADRPTIAEVEAQLGVLLTVLCEDTVVADVPPWLARVGEGRAPRRPAPRRSWQERLLRVSTAAAPPPVRHRPVRPRLWVALLAVVLGGALVGGPQLWAWAAKEPGLAQLQPRG